MALNQDSTMRCHLRTLIVALVLAGLPGCAVITVAGAAVSVTASAVGVAADVAVATGKGAVKAGSWAADQISDDKAADDKDKPKPKKPVDDTNQPPVAPEQ